jgi:hypothetical protein
LAFCFAHVVLALMFVSILLALLQPSLDGPPRWHSGGFIIFWAVLLAKVPIRMISLLAEQTLPVQNIQHWAGFRGKLGVPASFYAVRQSWRRQRCMNMGGALLMMVGSSVSLAILLIHKCDNMDSCVSQFGWAWACALFHAFVSIPLAFALGMVTFARLTVHTMRFDGFCILFPGLLDFRAVPKCLTALPAPEDRSRKLTPQEEMGQIAAAAISKAGTENENVSDEEAASVKDHRAWKWRFPETDESGANSQTGKTLSVVQSDLLHVLPAQN